MKIWTLSTISGHRFTMFQSSLSGEWLHSVDTRLPCSVMKIWTLSTISGHRFTMFQSSWSEHSLHPVDICLPCSSHEDLDIDYTQWTHVYYVPVIMIWTLSTISGHRFTMFQSSWSGHWLHSVDTCLQCSSQWSTNCTSKPLMCFIFYARVCTYYSLLLWLHGYSFYVYANLELHIINDWYTNI